MSISETGQHVTPVHSQFIQDHAIPFGPPIGDEHIPTMYADHMAGGLRTVNTWEDLVKIPSGLLQLGMLVYVASGASSGYYYKLCFVDDKLDSSATGAWKLVF